MWRRSMTVANLTALAERRYNTVSRLSTVFVQRFPLAIRRAIGYANPNVAGGFRTRCEGHTAAVESLAPQTGERATESVAQ